MCVQSDAVGLFFSMAASTVSSVGDAKQFNYTVLVFVFGSAAATYHVSVGPFDEL